MKPVLLDPLDEELDYDTDLAPPIDVDVDGLPLDDGLGLQSLFENPEPTLKRARS